MEPCSSSIDTPPNLPIGQDLPSFSCSSVSNKQLEGINNFSTDVLKNEYSSDTPQMESLKLKLNSWAVDNKISQNSFSRLLSILNNELGLNLPASAKTLLKSKEFVKVNIITIDGGSYYHFGLKTYLESYLKKTENTINSEILIQINVDGLPLAKSSGSQFWPILGSFKNDAPFPIGIFHGYSKPKDPNKYLKMFVEEYIDLRKNGLTHNNKKFTVRISGILCDAPAKAYILNVKSCNAHHGCTKCIVEGDYVNNRMIYTNLNASLRTDDGFASMTDEDYHKGPTVLSELKIGLVTHVPLDYMHLICLGVMKRLIQFWCKGNQTVRLHKEQILEINDKIMRYRQYCITEFARKPRNIDNIDRWKATELRQFLLYYGPVLMKPYLSNAMYLHFLSLHCAVRIMCTKELCLRYNEYANSLLKFFVENYSDIYGREYINHNVHNLIHIAADVKKYGPLDNFSCFKFENYMSIIKRSIKPGNYPLVKFIKRVYEHQAYSSKEVTHTDLNFLKSDGWKQINKKLTLTYSGIVLGTSKISNKMPNCYILLKDNIIGKVISVFEENKQKQLLFQQFSNFMSYFEHPCSSILLGCGKVGTLNKEIKVAHISDVIAKGVMFGNFFLSLCHNY